MNIRPEVLHDELRSATTWAVPPGCDAAALAAVLYVDWYLRRGEPSAVGPGPGRPTPTTADFGAALRTAHVGTRQFELGWHIEQVSSLARVLAVRGEESRVAGRADVVPTEQRLLPPTQGATASLASRNDSLEASPGFWLTGAGPWLAGPPEVPLVRLYWRLPWWEAPTFVHHATRVLDVAGTDYMLKVALPEPDHVCRRADSVVLYLARPDDGRLQPEVAMIAAPVAEHLGGAPPRLCHPIAPGLAVADDPGGNESFGQHRCRLVAEALLAGGLSPAGRALALIDVLSAAGLDPARPHLASCERPEYAFVSLPAVAHAPTSRAPRPGSTVIALRSAALVTEPVDSTRGERRGADTNSTTVHATANPEWSRSGERDRPPVAGPQLAWAVEAAEALARRLASAAVWHDGRCTWLGMGSAADGTIVGRSMDGDLYTGTAGIGWALAQVSATVGDDCELARAAQGAFAHSFDWAARAGPASFHGGPAGVAWAAVSAGLALDMDSLVDQGAQLAATHQGWVAETGDSVRACDLLVGDAGLVLGLLSLGRSLADSELVDAGIALAERLASRAVEVGPWSAWPNDIDPTEPALCGLGHGASGPALAIAAAARAAGQPQPEVVYRALDYERAWWRAEAGWPDLRGVASPDTSGTYGAPGWCHGAAGIGMARLALYGLAESEDLLAEAGAAIDVATRGVAAALAPPASHRRELANLSVCHGVGSVAELHLVAAEVSGDAEHANHAARLLARGLEIAPGEPLDLSGPIACGLPGGEAPGLLLGLAGVAALLARLGSPGDVPSIGLIPGVG